MKTLPINPFDLRSREHAVNPYKNYEWLRLNAPVSRLENGTIVLAKYSHVREALRDHRTFASGWARVDLAHPSWIAPERRRGKFLTESDPPEHTKYKSIMVARLGHEAMRAMIPALTERVRELIDGLALGTEFDFLTKFAYPFATFSIDQFSGLGTSDDLPRTQHWVQTAEAFTEVEPSDEEKTAFNELLRAQDEHYDRIAADRRANPRPDLAGSIATADALAPEQVRSAYNLITIGGFSSPAQAWASALQLLSERPGLFDQLKRSPDMIRPYIEELLRMYSAAQGSVRMSTTDAEIEGHSIPAGVMVLALTASANRDPDHFDDPDVFKFGRNNIKSHLGFGAGVHACIGEALARAQLEIVIREFVGRFSSIACPPSDALPWYSTIVGRLLKTLPMKLR